MTLDLFRTLLSGNGTPDQYAGIGTLAAVALGFLWIGIEGDRRRRRGQR